MNDLVHLGYFLLGGILVWLGMMAGAISDRIRHGRASSSLREPAPRERRRTPEVPTPARPAVPAITDAHEAMGRDVAKALVTAGYDRLTASLATQACAGSECSTMESWIRAALRRCMREEIAK